MKKKHIYLVIALTSLSLVGMLFFQTYWVSRAINLQKEQFNHRVALALNNVNQQLGIAKSDEGRAVQESEQIGNTFNLQVERSVDRSRLNKVLKSELGHQQIELDYEYGILSCNSGDMLMKTEQSQVQEIKDSRYQCSYMYGQKGCFNLAVYFPTLEEHIYQEAGTIIALPFLIILVFIGCFAYTIHVIMKQKKLSEIKTDFINNMTHELKTPISTISLASEVLKEPEISGNSEKSLLYANVIYNENLRLKGQVEKVLQMAQLDKGKLDLKFKKTDVHEVLQNAVHTIKLQLEECKGSIQSSFEAAHSIVTADDLHITNIICNLLDNAIKYSHDEPMIRVYSRNELRGVVVGVEDHGRGISKESQKQIFDQFYRVPTGDVHNVKGFGLGLHYVKVMVEAHGGKLWVKSELNKGSRFEFYLPHEQA